MSGPSWMYGDPMRVLERAQDMQAKRGKPQPKRNDNSAPRRPIQGCTGCIYRATLWDTPYCEKGNAKPGAVMQRCGAYEQKKGTP